MSKKAVQREVLPEGWRKVKLGDVSDCYSGGTPSTKSPQYYGGEIPWIISGDLNQRHIKTVKGRLSLIGVKNSSAKFVEKNTLLIALYGATAGTVAITHISAVINQAVLAINIKENYYNRFIFYTLEWAKDVLVSKYRQGGQPNLSAGIIKSINLHIPPLPEQKAIASLLEKWDTAIEKTEALIAAKEKRFKWLITLLINKKTYQKTHVSAFTTEVSNRNHDGVIERVLSVTNHRGFILPEEQFGHRIASVNLSNYKIVSRGQYAYNPSRINVGSIARLDDWNVGILSPMYVVFKLDEGKIHSDYFLYWLSASEAKQRIKNSAQGSVRETVSFDNLGTIPIPLPPMSDQKYIANILNTAQNETVFLKQLAEKYHTQKRGLMQKLLTGKYTVVPNKGEPSNG